MYCDSEFLPIIFIVLTDYIVKSFSACRSIALLLNVLLLQTYKYLLQNDKYLLKFLLFIFCEAYEMRLDKAIQNLFICQVVIIFESIFLLET